MRLIAENLGGERGGFAVFSGVSFSLAQGEALLVTGANGTGKSTLLRILAGLLPPSSGRVRLAEAEGAANVAGATHYLGHLNAMKPTLSVCENLIFWREFNGPGRDVGEALDMVELGDIGHLPYSYLSTGQRRRAAIARLLVSPRPVWLLDEPTSGLDAASEKRFSRLITDHLSGGGIIVAATHLPLGIERAGELRMNG